MEFIKQAEQISPIDLTKFFKDWFLGTKYVNYINNDLPINKIVSLYKKN